MIEPALALRLLVACGVIAAVLAALQLLLRRLALAGGRRTGGAMIRVVESRMLTQQASLHVVEVAGRQMVLGVTPQCVARVAEIAGKPSESSDTARESRMIW